VHGDDVHDRDATAGSHDGGGVQKRRSGLGEPS
jgi:hypothetical protein